MVEEKGGKWLELCRRVPPRWQAEEGKGEEVGRGEMEKREAERLRRGESGKERKKERKRGEEK